MPKGYAKGKYSRASPLIVRKIESQKVPVSLWKLKQPALIQTSSYLTGSVSTFGKKPSDHARVAPVCP